MIRLAGVIAIILTILKWIGLIILILLGILILMILAVLFAPVHYRVKGQYIGGQWLLSGWIGWILHLMHLSFCFENLKQDVHMRILGVRLRRRKKKEKAKRKKTKRKKTKLKKTKRKKTRSKNTGDNSRKTAPVTSTDPMHEENKRVPQHVQKEDSTQTAEDIDAGEETDNDQNGVLLFWKLLGKIFGRVKQFLVMLSHMFRSLAEGGRKCSLAKDFILCEETRAFIGMAWEQIQYFWRRIRPKRVKGWVHYGTSDPALTGQILGALAVWYGYSGCQVHISPDFEQEVLEGQLEIRGWIQGYVALKIAWKVLLGDEWKQFKGRYDQMKEEQNG